MEERITAREIGIIPLLDDRQRKECLLAVEYTKEFNHGTDGHNRLLLIDKLVRGYIKTLNQLESAQITITQLNQLMSKITDKELKDILER